MLRKNSLPAPKLSLAALVSFSSPGDRAVDVSWGAKDKSPACELQRVPIIPVPFTLFSGNILDGDGARSILRYILCTYFKLYFISQVSTLFSVGFSLRLLLLNIPELGVGGSRRFPDSNSNGDLSFGDGAWILNIPINLLIISYENHLQQNIAEFSDEHPAMMVNEVVLATGCFSLRSNFPTESEFSWHFVASPSRVSRKIF